MSGNGDWADCLLELDHDFGDLLDALEDLGATDNTIVILAGDNGAEDLLISRGSSGVFDGSYFSSSEGGLRTPCLIRWPGEVPPDRATNDDRSPGGHVHDPARLGGMSDSGRP